MAGLEEEQRGAALGIILEGWTEHTGSYLFIGHFHPTSGNVPSYTFVDSLDLTRRVGTWEIGPSLSYYEEEDERSWFFGPVVVRNDARGAWRGSVRGGSYWEARLVRTFDF